MRNYPTIASLTLMLAACGSGSSATDGGSADAELSDGAEYDAEPSDAEPSDAEPPDAEPSDAEVSDASGITLFGSIVISESVNSGGNDSNVETVFKAEPLFGIPAATAGGCSRYDANPATTGSSAGVIAITGTSLPITVTPSGVPPNVSYTPTPDPPPTDLFAPGATITATAPGADFPTFSIAADAPADLAGFTPPTSFSRSSPPNLTWTASTADTMLMQFITFDAAFSTLSVLICYTPDDGAFTVPASAMALLPASQTQGFLALVRINQTTINPSATTQLDLLVGVAEGSDLGTLGP